jgi:hypothetical protein
VSCYQIAGFPEAWSIIARLVVPISPVLFRARLVVRERDQIDEEEKEKQALDVFIG